MRDWHIEHMERTLVKYIRGVSEDATGWEKRLNKRYGTFWRVSKRLEYDIKHGVEREQVYSYLQSIRTEPSFTEVRSNEGSMKRLDQIQEYFQ